MSKNKYVGIGFRRDIADVLMDDTQFNPAFIELAPENWIGMGGYWRKKLLINNLLMPSGTIMTSKHMLS